jgi:molybdate transport system substrate-binding protein
MTAVLALLLAGGTGSSETVRVFAAASLVEAFTDVASAFERAHPGRVVELSFGGSQWLRTQIEQGAPADVFAGADVAHAEALRRSGRLGSYRIFARNDLVVAVPASGGTVRNLEDLAKPGVRLVVAGPTVPAGRYTSEVLGKLSAEGSFGADFASRVRANVLSHETSVRAVLSKVVLGEADAGFVYATDASSSSKVRAIEIPAGAKATADYPIGVVIGAAAPGAARAFVDFVLGEDGQARLRRHGFRR